MVIILFDDFMFKLIVVKWLIFNSEWIYEKGIMLDVVVNMLDYVIMIILFFIKVYKNGDFGDDVKIIEILLKVLDYNVGKVDGLYDIDIEYVV